MSEPNASWAPGGISEENENFSDFSKALEAGSNQLQEEDNEQGAPCSGLWNLSDFPSEPMVQDDTSREPLSDFKENLYHPPSTSTGVVESSRGSRSVLSTRGTRTRYRSSGRVTFGFSRGQRGESNSRQEQTRGSRSRGRSDAPQPRGDRGRARGRSHSLGHRRTPSPLDVLEPEAEERLNTMMNNFSLLYMAPPSNPDDSYTP